MHFKSSRGYDVLHALSAISLARPGKVQTSHYFSARGTASTAIATLFIAPPTGLNRLKKGARRPEGERERAAPPRLTWNLSKPIFYRPCTSIYIYVCIKYLRTSMAWNRAGFGNITFCIF